MAKGGHWHLFVMFCGEILPFLELFSIPTIEASYNKIKGKCNPEKIL
jgi:hypothetical protein